MEPFQSAGFQGCWSLICVKLMSRITSQPPGASEAISEGGLVCTLVRVFDGDVRIAGHFTFLLHKGEETCSRASEVEDRPSDSFPSAAFSRLYLGVLGPGPVALVDSVGTPSLPLWLRGLPVLLRTWEGERWLMGEQSAEPNRAQLCPLPYHPPYSFEVLESQRDVGYPR